MKTKFIDCYIVERFSLETSPFLCVLKMMNSLCGSIKKENSSCSSSNHHHQPTSPTTSVSESNNIVASAASTSTEFEPSISNSLNLNFQGLKFNGDADEVQSPNSALWESLFGDQSDSCTDFMISSPIICSPRRNTTDFMISSPNRNHNHNYNYSYMQGPSPLGSSSSPSSQSQVGAYNTIQKGKVQSPLHRVLASANQFGNVPLPGTDGFTDDYQRDCFGTYSTMKATGVGCLPDQSFNAPTTLAEMLNYSHLQNSSSFCGSVSEVGAQGGLQQQQQMSRERDVYQMNSFATLPQQQQDLDHTLLGSLSTGSEKEQDSGLQLVHLLLACAEAVAKEDYMAARRYLHHLNSVVTPLGDSMQRVASCFTDALGARLAPTLANSPNTTSNPKPFPPFPLNSLEAIFEAFEDEERVHIIDLDILQGYQWPAFMQALASRSNGVPFLRITGVGSPAEAVRETGRCLAELANSLHIPFEFHPVGEALEDLKPHMFHRRVGEALAVNSVNRLHRVPASHLGNLLGIIRDQAPNIVTLVEQEASHNGPYFLGRFLEALHYYSAIFDSLDSTFPPESAERAKVEQYIFAPEIRNIVACEGAERVERHERLEKWRKVMEGKGFKSVALSPNAVTQSKILLGLYPCEAYRLNEDKGCLLLGWQDRPLIAASAWRC